MKENTYIIIKDETGNDSFMMEASGDRIIVEEDKFKTGYECRTCDGERFSKNPCGNCNGTGKEGLEQICRPCEGTGKSYCSTCQGRGGSIIVPETAAKRPTSGIIRSIGKDVNTIYDELHRPIGVRLDNSGTPWLKIGDRVMYALFAGIAIQFKQRGVCRILHENEVMCKLYGTGNLGKQVQ